MTIIGLDLSLTAPGYARWCNGEITTGVIPVHKDLRGAARMGHVAAEVMRLDPLNGGRPIYFIEDIAPGARGSAVHEHAGLAWMIRCRLWQMGNQFTLVSPSALKKYATGKGNADKNIVLRSVWQRWQFEARDDNEADAYVLMQIGLAMQGVVEPTTQQQREVIAALRAGPVKKAKRRAA